MKWLALSVVLAAVTYGACPRASLTHLKGMPKGTYVLHINTACFGKLPDGHRWIKNDGYRFRFGLGELDTAWFGSLATNDLLIVTTKKPIKPILIDGIPLSDDERASQELVDALNALIDSNRSGKN